MALYAYDGATPWTDDNDPTDRSRLKSIAKHSGIAVTVYIVGSPGNMRCAIKRDVDAARELELGVVPNWERAADFFRTASIADCKDAGKEALAACRQLGFPDDASIGCAFSFDYQVPASGYRRATDQLKACGDGMGGHYVPLGYGQTELIEYWAAHGMPGPHWLMGSTWGASSQFTGPEVGSPHVAMVQSHDAAGNWLVSLVRDTDINTVTQPDKLLAWWPDDSPYGGDMLTEDQMRQIVHDEIAKFTYLDDKDTTTHHFVTVAKVASADLEQKVDELTAAVAQLHSDPIDKDTLAAALAQAITDLAQGK